MVSNLRKSKVVIITLCVFFRKKSQPVANFFGRKRRYLRKIWWYFFKSLENGHFVVLKYTEKTAPGIKTSVKEERMMLPSFWCSRNCVKLIQSKVMSRTSCHFCRFRIRLDRVHDRIKFTIGLGFGLKRVTIGIDFNTGSGLRLNCVSRLDQVYDWIGFRIESSNHWNRVKYWIRFTVEWRFTIRSRFTIGSGLGLVPFFYSTSYHHPLTQLDLSCESESLFATSIIIDLPLSNYMRTSSSFILKLDSTNGTNR